MSKKQTPPNVVIIKDKSSGSCAQAGCGFIVAVIGILLILFVVGAAMSGGG